MIAALRNFICLRREAEPTLTIRHLQLQSPPKMPMPVSSTEKLGAHLIELRQIRKFLVSNQRMQTAGKPQCNRIPSRISNTLPGQDFPAGRSRAINAMPEANHELFHEG